MLSFGCCARQAGVKVNNTEFHLNVRPTDAIGSFLRIVTVNDVYSLKNYPHVATAIKETKGAQGKLDCVVKSFINGDFAAPSALTSLDGGKGMIGALDVTHFDYACLGNHEFDIGIPGLAKQLKELKECQVINSNAHNEELAFLPKHSVFNVGKKRVLVGGFLTDEATIYHEESRPIATPINESIIELFNEIHTDEEPVDLYLPMTHQYMPEDRETGTCVAAHNEIAEKTPVFLGGHNHEVFVENVSDKTQVVKVGQDAKRIGIVDIWWDSAGKLHSSVNLMDAKEFAPDQEVLAYQEQMDDYVKSVMEAEIAVLPCAMSSKNARFEECDVATFLLDLLKRGFRRENVDVAILNGGAVRAGRDYKAGPFTMNDLFQEIAFECRQILVDLPGWVLSESIQNTKKLDKPAPNLLHTDSGVQFDEDGSIVSVAGEPFNREKLYKICTDYVLLKGLNAIEPLCSYLKDNPDKFQLPPPESCRPAKDVIIYILMRDKWREVLGFDPRQVRSGTMVETIDQLFTEIDVKHVGWVDREQLQEKFVERFGEVPSESLLTCMIESLDEDHDGRISRFEMAALRPNRASLLEMGVSLEHQTSGT